MMSRLKTTFRLIALILAFLLVGVISLGVIEASLVQSSRSLERERVRLTETAAKGIASWFDTGKAQADSLAAALSPWRGTAQQALAAQSTIDEFLSGSVFNKGSLIVDQSFRVVATSTSRSAEIAVSRKVPHFENALRGQQVLTGIHEDPFDRSPVITLSLPLRDGERTTGAISLSATTAGLIELVKRYQIEGAALYLVSPDGSEISEVSTPEAATPASNDGKRPAEEARAGKKAGFVDYRGEASVEKAAGFAPVAGEWSAVVTSDAEDFYPYKPRFAERLLSPGATRTTGLVLAVILAVSLAGLLVLHASLKRADARAEAAKNAFLAITGHELRTPLTSIRGYTQLLQRRWKDMEEKQRDEMLDTVARQAKNLEYLVERLLTASQLEAGMLAPVSARAVDMKGLLTQLVKHFGPQAPLHELVVEASQDEELIVNGDTKALEQVFSNLVENAIKYSPEGGTISISAEKDGKWIHVGVEDEGVGLPADPSQIFEKFVQNEAVDTRVYDEGGVGLGLFIARQHIERLGGRIRAERRSPSGSRFVVSLRSRG
jgi:signal transduction histidine kinase